MTRCAYTSRLMSVVGPEVMLNKYNLELKKKKKAIPVALQSHSSTSWEIQVLKQSQSLKKLSSVKKIMLGQKMMPFFWGPRGGRGW